MHIKETSEQGDLPSKSDHVWGRYLGTEQQELSTVVFKQLQIVSVLNFMFLYKTIACTC